MRVAVVVEQFHRNTATFIHRHVLGLQADVFAVNAEQGPHNARLWQPHITSLGAQLSKPRSRAQRALRRGRQAILGVPLPRWPEGVDALWDRYCTQRRPDVALAEFAPTAMCALEACRRTEVPLVTHFHGYDATSMLRHRRYARALPPLFEGSSAVVIVGSFMHDRLQRLGCPGEKIHLIPCGASIDEFQPSRAVAAQPCRFIAVSSFTPMKGTLHTLKAFRTVAQRVPGVTLTMIGDGHELERARGWARAKGMQDRVALPGRQPVEYVSSHMGQSGAFVQHSRTTRTGHLEGWGVSIAEAAASALPVVSTRVGGIPDHVIDGTTGYLVEEGDWRTMALKMEALARDPALRIRMGNAGRRNIEVVGSVDRQIKALRRVLKTVATERRAGDNSNHFGEPE